MTDAPRIARGSLSATELAATATCETQVALTRRYGKRATVQQVEARQRGDREHARFHVHASAHHNHAQRKGPCFVATCVYGAEDPRTWRLRRFRDAQLRPYWLGRQCIAMYYATSPKLVAWLSNHPCATDGVRWLLDRLVAVLERKDQG